MIYMNARTGRKRRYERLTESGDGDGAPVFLSSLSSFIGITPVVFVRASNYRSVGKFARRCASPRWEAVRAPRRSRFTFPEFPEYACNIGEAPVRRNFAKFRRAKYTTSGFS